MDGYIKNMNGKIKNARKVIFYKCSISFLIFIFLPVWIFAIITSQPPEKWTQTNIVYSGIWKEHIGLRRYSDFVIHADDGRKYVIDQRLVNANTLTEKLTIGNVYSLIYTTTLTGDGIVQCLSDDKCEILDLETSIEFWESEQQEYILAIGITIGLGIITIIIIDRTWCKHDHAIIRDMKDRINRRQEKSSRNM